uniref:Uncharacterized protein n=1 Tax=Chromera velia CCMP2878 TaxID=1169474 RepID=A0A0G4HUD6_9ALVE|mmetsp:Transcript_18055/g.36625  ORF Transcript_18055/g.36625 Transcript_18055/m.36625 type:complete len:480 (+) Transcript_18055:223-1662(+)|eukprot:Cvel_8632.t1-p1 / transcript=Cvel_8632.t1 / gene=Cvel_8632 / organism=Chromera_velia_CCMP2878 / gene_product=hypothetical protein / transcript_product=hypothetical protein / location=Cvel_scaffold480:76431-81438(+) / protein_length=479 / sequence_SO=supercontig / SO=protein_coding / is_pseudo=false
MKKTLIEYGDSDSEAEEQQTGKKSIGLPALFQQQSKQQATKRVLPLPSLLPKVKAPAEEKEEIEPPLKKQAQELKAKEELARQNRNAQGGGSLLNFLPKPVNSSAASLSFESGSGKVLGSGSGSGSGGILQLGGARSFVKRQEGSVPPPGDRGKEESREGEVSLKRGLGDDESESDGDYEGSLLTAPLKGNGEPKPSGEADEKKAQQAEAQGVTGLFTLFNKYDEDSDEDDTAGAKPSPSFPSSSSSSSASAAPVVGPVMGPQVVPGPVMGPTFPPAALGGANYEPQMPAAGGVWDSAYYSVPLPLGGHGMSSSSSQQPLTVAAPGGASASSSWSQQMFQQRHQEASANAQHEGADVLARGPKGREWKLLNGGEGEGGMKSIASINADSLRDPDWYKRQQMEQQEKQASQRDKKKPIVTQRWDPEQRAAVMATLPGGTSKKKHQISWLAHEAQEREAELVEKMSQSRKTKGETYAKYGW